MTDFGDHSPRRYFVDENGRRVLIGLTIEETFEFETLDSLPALDENGNHVAWDEKGIPTTTREKRWLELYSKHDQAWRQWLAESYADRRGGLGFINQDGVI
jgi:hypothetical protein